MTKQKLRVGIICEFRHLVHMINNKYLSINEKKLISFNAKESAFKRTIDIHNKNMLSLGNFIYRLFNQIKIINS